MTDWTVETVLATVPGLSIVVNENRRVENLARADSDRDHDEHVSALNWISNNPEAVQAWIESREHDPSRVIIDTIENFWYAIRLIKRVDWPNQDSPNNTEKLLLNLEWWCACIDAKGGSNLSGYYANRIIDLLAPGNVEEDVRGRALAMLGNRAAILASLFEMNPMIRGWATMWRKSGFCKVEVAPKAAAALMASDSPRDVMAPWEGFSVIVPPGLCDPVRRLWCASAPADGRVILLSAVDETGKAWATEPSAKQPAPWATRERHSMLVDLMLGTCIAIENGAAERRGGNHPIATTIRPECAPLCERWCLTAPIEIDLRDEVKEQWRNDGVGSPKKSQWGVRGHYRNQACGQRLAERKRIWIHPYRKGDKGAISLLRRVVLTDKVADLTETEKPPP